MVRCWCGYLSGARCRLAHAQLMPLPLTISCCSKIQIGFTFLVLAHPGSPGQTAVKWVYVCYMAHVCKGHKRAMSAEMATQLSVSLSITNYQDTCTHTTVLWFFVCSRQITTPAHHQPVFLQARCPSCRPTNSIKALKA